MNDKKLLERLKKNDKSVFEELFRRYVPALNEYAYFYVMDMQVAEDIVQDLFAKIWESRSNLNIRVSLRAYLYRSTHNSCIQHLRHKNVSGKHEKFVQSRLNEARIMNQFYFESGINKLFEVEIQQQVAESLKKLPPKTSEIFLLSRNKYLKNSEIAEKFKLTEKSVEYHMTRALEVLRNDLKEYLDG